MFDFDLIFYRPFNFNNYFNFSPSRPKINKNTNVADVTSHLHKPRLLASHKINKIYIAAALFMYEFVCVHAPGILHNISVISSQSYFKS